MSVGNESILIEIFNLSRIFDLSRLSTDIFGILQSTKILTLWRMYLTKTQVVPQAQTAQWEMCQHEEIPSRIWILLLALSDAI